MFYMVNLHSAESFLSRGFIAYIFLTETLPRRVF